MGRELSAGGGGGPRDREYDHHHPSTEGYDRGEKLEHYKSIPSLKEVVLVAHDRAEVEIVRRKDDGSWSRHISADEGSARIACLGVDLSVPAVYRDPLG